MAYARAMAAGVTGVSGRLVEIEADLANGLPAMVISGLPDTALNEARDRVRAAVTNSGLRWPDRRLTVNLLPAALPKHGTAFDLAMAAAVLGCAAEIPPAALGAIGLIGELGLDGAVRPIRGVLPMALALRRSGVRTAIVPDGNAAEAAVVPGLSVRRAASLAEVVAHLRGETSLPGATEEAAAEPAARPDLADVAGQQLGRRGIEIAAAGGHHLALIGPPGAGKTMLAERLPSVLPELDDDGALEVTALHSIAGHLQGGRLIRQPPFQTPHHSASAPALVGGGPGLARPGAISLAHRGVLFLDEAPEFAPHALESLRQPLETGRIVLRRSNGAAEFPARFQLVLAANPCPCAKPGGDAYCECPAQVRRRYLGRLSGPLMDRIDLRVELMPLRTADLLGAGGESSAAVAARVANARQAAAARWAPFGRRVNGEAPGNVLRSSAFQPGVSHTRRLRQWLDRGALSARGFDRTLKVAWTVADLDGRDQPTAADIDEALGMRAGQP
ncbi:YifB family Mg chelatase-like AAA ATPase [Pilimelia columellifera]|uniref:YifB family Mg chelatase-like AAA ATPase n=1 Tax=Pilimelia columellifera subsp. columellifera TaxID=706583 RepID=A0ABN3N3I4_9ACTN